MNIFTKEVVVAMNPLHSQRKERNVLRGSSGTIPDGSGRGVRLQNLQIIGCNREIEIAAKPRITCLSVRSLARVVVMSVFEVGRGQERCH